MALAHAITSEAEGPLIGGGAMLEKRTQADGSWGPLLRQAERSGKVVAIYPRGVMKWASAR